MAGIVNGNINPNDPEALNRAWNNIIAPYLTQFKAEDLKHIESMGDVTKNYLKIWAQNPALKSEIDKIKVETAKAKAEASYYGASGGKNANQKMKLNTILQTLYEKMNLNHQMTAEEITDLQNKAIDSGTPLTPATLQAIAKGSMAQKLAIAMEATKTIAFANELGIDMSSWAPYFNIGERETTGTGTDTTGTSDENAIPETVEDLKKKYHAE